MSEVLTESLLHISLRGLRLIYAEGEAAYPEECCGFLYGRDTDTRREIIEVRPVGNEQGENRARRFLISPEQFRQAEDYARESGLDLLGFYHSHPDHPAVPSEFDREHALPFYSYIIVSVRKGKTAETRSWQLDDNREGYSEERIEIR